MSKSWRVRDAVHNFVHFSDSELKLLNSKGLQRLRNVRQLAMASLVYPGALHTRFDHTIGVAHVAGQMCDYLLIRDGRRDQVMRAALLHDVGHGPFSHVSESVLDALAPDFLKGAKKKEKIHELVTKKIIEDDLGETHLDPADRAQVVALLNDDDFSDRILRQIVSGPLDADKQDYLLRDSLYCGVPYGRFDIHQLHRSLAKYGPDEDETLVVKSEGIGTLEQFALAKYAMTNQVYRHKGRVISDQMIVRGLMLTAKNDSIEEITRLYTYEDSEDWHREYLAWDDVRLLERMRRIAEEDNTKLGPQMFDRLLTRRLFKAVCLLTEQDLPEDLKGVAFDVAKEKQDEIETWATEEIASAVGKKVKEGAVSRNEVILHTYRVDSLGKMVNNDDTIQVLGHKTLDLLVDRSVLFRSIDASRHNRGLILIAPLPESISQERRRKIRSQVQERLLDKIRSLAPKPLTGENSPQVSSATQ